MEVQTDKQKRSYSPNPVPVGEKSSSANPRIGMGQEGEEKKQTPPSAASHSSSPSHEFSFTISLCSSNNHHNQKNIPISIDLSPADDLFLHGQLLPLHLLSTNSPRPSTTTTTTITSSLEIENLPNKENIPASNIRKPKSFSFSSLISSKWRSKTTTGGGRGERDIGLLGGNRLSKILHKYLRAVRPLFGRIGEKKGRQTAYPCSFSGNLQSSSRRRNGSGGEWSSAPASKRPSPTNSGLLIMPNNASNFPSSYSSNDSTMEELHTAIQAAIAHCKNSIDVKEESCKC